MASYLIGFIFLYNLPLFLFTHLMQCIYFFPHWVGHKMKNSHCITAILSQLDHSSKHIWVAEAFRGI